VLGDADIKAFIEGGYLHLRRAFSLAVAAECRTLAAQQLGIDLSDPRSWDRPVVRGLVEGRPLGQAANSRRLVEAVAQLVEPDRWERRPNLGAFVVRFPSEMDPGDTGWHIDSSYQPGGDPRWFVNYKSKHRALLLLCLLSDVGPDDAPTRILPGSHRQMPRLLRPAGDRGLPGAAAGQSSEIRLPDFDEEPVLAVGEAGDVFICHPFLVHAAGWPHRGRQPRFISQPPISVPGSVEIDGPIEGLSPVAMAIRRGLE
jgi:Phytanoyl-CoA dioxygenase (PhyH)